MAVRTKNRRKIQVRDRNFVWYVGDDRDSDDKVLHVVSDDKKFVINYHLGQSPTHRHLIILGQEFPKIPGAEPYLRIGCPQWEENETITPGCVRRLIDWCFDDS